MGYKNILTMKFNGIEVVLNQIYKFFLVSCNFPDIDYLKIYLL